MAAFFVTGTDTDSGKTLITLALMHGLQQAGLKVNAMKPVAAGTTVYPEGLMNEDAMLLQQQSSVKAAYQLLNPYLFKEPVAPHIAARYEKVQIDMASIASAFDLLKQQAEVTLVEGAGGWLVPMNDRLDIADIAVQLKLPVILVVGLKLGCINHARLSVQSIYASGCQIAGWVGTQVDPEMSRRDENIETLTHYINAPCLGVVPFLSQPTVSAVAEYLTYDDLLNRIG